METFILIGWFIKLIVVKTFQPLIVIYRKGYFVCIIIGNVHQLIDHCLIPLDTTTIFTEPEK